MDPMEDDVIYIKLLDSTEQIPFLMTYGIHLELQKYLGEGDNLFKLLQDATVAEEVISICLSKRDSMGMVTNTFIEIQQVAAKDMLRLLTYVFDYFSDFFLNNQKKVKELTDRLNKVASQ